MLKMKFYTAWLIFCQDSVNHKTLKLHCTHKFLGGQTQNSMGAVFRITNKFMQKLGPKGGWPRANFTIRDEFGGPCTCSSLVNLEGQREECENCRAGRKPVSVLTTPDSVDCFWPYLRAELEQFRADDYPEYRPHITIPNYPEVTGHFQAYAIMNGDKVVIHWNNPHWERLMVANERRARMRAVKPGGLD